MHASLTQGGVYPDESWDYAPMNKFQKTKTRNNHARFARISGFLEDTSGPGVCSEASNHFPH
jgi:hypothetical protein